VNHERIDRSVPGQALRRDPLEAVTPSLVLVSVSTTYRRKALQWRRLRDLDKDARQNEEEPS